MAFRPSFLPQFKNDKSNKKPFDNGSVYKDVLEVSRSKNNKENPDLEELLDIRKRKAGKSYRSSIIRSMITLILIGISIWFVISILINET